MCGVLTTQGYGPEGSLTFLVPSDSSGPEVARYEAIDATGQPAPLSVYAGWWVCVLRGRVLARPAPEETVGSPYGKLEVQEITVDQSTGERGQE